MPPITRQEFEKGRKTHRLEQAILQFLGNHRNQAFTLQELGRGVGVLRGINLIEDSLAIGQLNTAIRGLLRDRSVLSKVVSGQVYYSSG